jgi:hypothetical protein
MIEYFLEKYNGIANDEMYFKDTEEEIESLIYFAKHYVSHIQAEPVLNRHDIDDWLVLVHQTDYPDDEGCYNLGDYENWELEFTRDSTWDEVEKAIREKIAEAKA